MRLSSKSSRPKSPNLYFWILPLVVSGNSSTKNTYFGTLYLAIAIIFCAQIAGVPLTIEQQLIIMFALMVTSKGIAGVPRVALIVLAGTLSSFNIPIIGVAILLGIDQLLDMGRTTVNLIGNCVATVVIARWENEFDYEKMNNYISSAAEKLESKPYLDESEN